MIRAEWIRLRGRFDLWLGLGAVLILTTLAYASGLSAGTSGLDLGHGGEGASRFAFPESIVSLLGSTVILVVAVAAYAAAATTGADFSYGTIRSSLLARSDRTSFMLTRLLGVTVYAAVLVSVVVGTAAVLPLLALGVGVELEGRATSVVPGILVAGSALLFARLALTFTSLVTLVVKNSAISLLVVVAYGAAEGLVSSMLHRAAGGEFMLLKFLPLSSLQALVQQAIGAPITTLPGSVLVAVAVGWIASGATACAWVLHNMDVVE
jgi:hypothetical protein